MPKLIDYPRTSYTSAWEVAEVVDDTGGKCALETCARKLNRKVSGSFKAIVGSAVKFGLLTSKRELLTTTTLFRRIKHAYDKQEELLFHREAFLTPALFTQICRKFRTRELPVAMLDVLLIREFDVEEINAQSVAKAFVDGARMVGVLDEHNIVADIDQLSARQTPRREISSPTPASNTFRQLPATAATTPEAKDSPLEAETLHSTNAESTKGGTGDKQPTDTAPAKLPLAPASTTVATANGLTLPASRPAPPATSDAIATLFGIGTAPAPTTGSTSQASGEPTAPIGTAVPTTLPMPSLPAQSTAFRLQLSGPGINTDLDISDADDLLVARALLEKIERLLRRG